MIRALNGDGTDAHKGISGSQPAIRDFADQTIKAMRNVEERLDALEQSDTEQNGALAADATAIASLTTRVTALEQAPPDPPDPPDPPVAVGPLFGRIMRTTASGVGSGNEPIRSASDFERERFIVDRPAETQLRIRECWLHAKGFKLSSGQVVVEQGYGSGSPRWRVRWYAIDPASGGLGAVIGTWQSGDPAALPADDKTLLRNMIPGGYVHITGLDVPYQDHWREEVELTRDGSYASANYRRCDGVASKAQQKDDWANRGKVTEFGLDAANVVWHTGYAGKPVWGDYDGSGKMIALPSSGYVVSDGTFEGQPFYDDWTAGQTSIKLRALRAGTVRMVTGPAGARVTVLGQAVTIGSGPTPLPVPTPVAKGDLIGISVQSGGQKHGMDGTMWSAVGAKMGLVMSGDGSPGVGLSE